jgi:hypothetical protein
MAVFFSVLPESVEPIGRQFRVPDAMLDSPVFHVVLDHPYVMSVIGDLEAAPVTEHVRMDREGNSGMLPCPRHQLAHRRGGQQGSELTTVNNNAWALLNAVTEHLNHQVGHDMSTRLHSPWLGPGEKLKRRILSELKELAEAAHHRSSVVIDP